MVEHYTFSQDSIFNNAYRNQEPLQTDFEGMYFGCSITLYRHQYGLDPISNQYTVVDDEFLGRRPMRSQEKKRWSCWTLKNRTQFINYFRKKGKIITVYDSRKKSERGNHED